jgi:hypothetical protein
LLLPPNEPSGSDDSTSLSPIERLQRLVSQYRELTYHPVLATQLPRIEKVRGALKRELQDAIASKRKEDNTIEAFTLLRMGSSANLDPLN